MTEDIRTAAPRRGRSTLVRPQAGEVRIRVGALGLSSFGVQAVGRVEAVGPQAAGFAPGDRVLYPFTAKTPGISHIVGERDLIGFPKDVAIEQAAALLPRGLVARRVVKQLHSIGRGNTVSVATDAEGLSTFVAAWARHLGAIIVEENADIAITERDYAVARTLKNGHGTAQLAASDVFEAVRIGVFDDVQISRYPLSDAARVTSQFASSPAPGPVVLLAA